MSMRFVDLQTLLPRALEVSRVQEAGQKGPETAQQVALQQLHQVTEAAPRRVPPAPASTGRWVQDATEEGRRQGQRHGSPGRQQRRPERDGQRPQADSRPPRERGQGRLSPQPRHGGAPSRHPAAARREARPAGRGGPAVPGLGQHVDVLA